MKIAILLAVLCVAALALPMSKEEMLRDPTARMLAIGFKNLPTSVETVHEFSRKQFPNLIGARNATSPMAAGELARLEVLVLALRERNAPGDADLAHRLSEDLACECCTWVVNELYGKLSSGGCTLAEPAFAGVCAAIPYVDVVVDVCVWVLNWGCNKLVSYIENGIQSPTELCNDVFDDCCAGSSSASSSGGNMMFSKRV